MYKTHWILLTIFVTGLIILLLPDNHTPVIRLNQKHGPSFLDLAGLVLILTSWLISTIIVIKHWKQITKKEVATFHIFCSFFISFLFTALQ